MTEWVSDLPRFFFFGWAALTARDDDEESETKDGSNTELLLHLHLELHDHRNGQADDWRRVS